MQVALKHQPAYPKPVCLNRKCVFSNGDLPGNARSDGQGRADAGGGSAREQHGQGGLQVVAGNAQHELVVVVVLLLLLLLLLLLMVTTASLLPNAVPVVSTHAADARCSCACSPGRKARSARSCLLR